MAQLFNLRELPKYECIAAISENFPQITADDIQSWLVLLKTSSDLIEAFEKHTGQYDLSPGRFTVLMMVFHSQEELTPSELADRMGCTRATMTGLLDGLEHAGLIVRVPQDTDRRTIIIRLTPKGQTEIDTVVPHHFTQVSTFMSCLDERERKTLVKLLDKVRGSLSELRGARPRFRTLAD